MTEVLLPQWGMGMTEGTVITWLRAVGDLVEEGEDLVEIEAAKATACVVAPASGRLIEIRAVEDETVHVFDVLAVIDAP